MTRSKAAAPSARLALVVFAAALAAGVLIFVGVHRGVGGTHPAPERSGSSTAAGAQDRAAR